MTRHGISRSTRLAGITGSYWSELGPQLGHLHQEELEKIEFGLKIAYFAHDGQYRKSGEPFIIHPVGVASLLGGLQMDVDTVVAGLLHDTVEDTDLTFLQVGLRICICVRIFAGTPMIREQLVPHRSQCPSLTITLTLTHSPTSGGTSFRAGGATNRGRRNEGVQTAEAGYGRTTG